jgi:hypothetical protein
MNVLAKRKWENNLLQQQKLSGGALLKDNGVTQTIHCKQIVTAP